MLKSQSSYDKIKFQLPSFRFGLLKYFLLFGLFVIGFSQNLQAEPGSEGIAEKINSAFVPLVQAIEKVLFWDPFLAFGIDVGARAPLVVIWLLLAGIYFTFRMGFINLKGFGHAIGLVSGRFRKPGDPGEVSSFQALATALSATVGLGNIAGVAIAISIGGPGATFWMIMAGFFGMTLKFTECTLGMKYRKINERGEVSGGPMYYLRDALSKKPGMKNLGRVLSVLFAVMIVLASWGGGNMFQSNQAFSQMVYLFPGFSSYGFLFGIIMAFLVGIVIIGGIKSIARVTARIVPFMAILYVSTSLVIIFLHISEIGHVFSLILQGAFAPESIKGGFFGVLIIGIQRGAFSNEAGMGSASIAHSVAKVREPVSEGFVALLEPFIDTVVICTMTSLVIIFTGLYQNPDGLEGAQLTSAAFATVIPWYPYLLGLAILLFAFSTMISWSYYGLKGFDFLFSKRVQKVFGSPKPGLIFYQLIFLFFIVVGSSSGLGAVMDFSDMMILSLAFPNIIGLLILAPEVKRDLRAYLKRRKEGT
jgi:alanine or glycine:cation symporter, AGCS family